MLASALALACACIHGTIAQRKVLPPGSCTTFRAGAAKVDLTPTPGYPLGGFSIAGHMSRGVWAPLEARAIYLQDASCHAVALISTDLEIMPSGLADRVADKLSHDDTTRQIGRENMLLTATENHLSPGNFFSSPLYNSFSSPVPGFDPDLFEFLADRIAQAVRAAVASQQEAVLRTGHTVLHDFFRNRAFGAFLRNRDAYDFLKAAGDSGAAPCPTLPYASHPLASLERFHELSCLAISPRVNLIEVLSADGSKRIALAGFLATHTTVLPATVEVFSADLFGITALRMERGELPADCAGAGAFPVVALFNGAQGDVTTQWSTRDRADLLGMSDRITGAICKTLPEAVEAKSDLAFQYEEAEPLTSVSFEDPFDDQKYEQQTPDEPDGGAPELGGAPDGRTVLYEVAQREEVTSFRRTQHGSKLAPLTFDLGRSRISLGTYAFRLDQPPRKAPLTVLQVGETVLVGVPGEMSTMMGDRTRTLIAKQDGISREQIVIVGFGNGHVSYFPTTEEYDAQYYEGASDYYGPGTGSYLAVQLSGLAAKLSETPTWLGKHSYSYDPGQQVSFRARDVGPPAYHVDDGLWGIVQTIDLEPTPDEPTPKNVIVSDAPQLRIPKRDDPTWCFLDALPRLDKLQKKPSTPGCHRNVPEIEVHRKGEDAVATVDGRLQDSGGTEIVTVLAAAGRDRAEWCAIWLAPHDTDGDGVATNLDTAYEFRARGITWKDGDPLLQSPPFTLRDGVDQDDPHTLTCDASKDAEIEGAIFTERATCTPLDRPSCSGWFEAFCDIGIDYCKAP